MRAIPVGAPFCHLASAIEAASHRLPGSVPLGQLAPGGAGRQKPEDTLDDPLVVTVRSIALRLLRWEKSRQALSLRFDEFVAFRTSKAQIVYNIHKWGLVVDLHGRSDGCEVPEELGIAKTHADTAVAGPIVPECRVG